MSKFKGEQIEFLKNKQYITGDKKIEDRFDDIVNVVKKYEKDYSEGLGERVRYMLENQILSLSTPQLANLGRKSKGNTTDLNCSCNIITVPNSISGIYYSIGETAMLSKLGAGVGADFQGVSDKGTYLEEGFYSNPKLDWVEDLVSASQKVSQGARRRGYSVPFFSILDKEFYDIMERFNKNNPDKKDPFVSNNVGISLPVGFRSEVRNGNKEYQKRWLKVLQAREGEGKIYLVDEENMNKNISPVYEKLGHVVKSTNICTEVVTPHYEDKTFACIIASINASNWDQITDRMIVDMFMFLDINVSVYIELTEGVPFLEKARRSAMEKRDIGLGVLGFHDYLQSKGCTFGDLQSRRINKEMFKRIRRVGEQVTEALGIKLGSPKMSEEANINRRNVSLMMVAPNKSTSFIQNNTSQGVEPYKSNYFIRTLAGIQSVTKNRHLERLLESKDKNSPEVWDSILTNLGSVQHLEFLSDQEKSVFKTASEISPKDIIDLAADRQEHIDMAQSINLFSRPNYTTKDTYDIHMYAFDKGLKTLYYYFPQMHAALEKDGERWDTCESCAD
jgi:ribonucleoside-diphosphate reductase alpha chain